MDGTNRQRLTQTPVDETLPRWSADGRWLVYEVNDAFFIERYVQLHDLETGIIRPLTRDYSQMMWTAWSPVSSLIAYVKIVRDKARIYIQDVVSGEERALLPDFQSDQFFPAWSPDGSRLALLTRGAVYIVDADGQNARQVSGGGIFSSTPAWSADGKRLAYMEGRSQYTVYVVDTTDESAQPQVVYNGRLYYAPVWKPG